MPCRLLCLPDGLPGLYPDFAQHARLAEEFGLSRSEGKTCFLAVQREAGWPFLVVAQQYRRASGS